MQMQWKILQPERTVVEQIRRRFECHPVTATVLANRNIGSLDHVVRFIRPSLDDLPPPDALQGLSAAVDRIIHALQNNERILVFGDYDADGVTAGVVMFNFLKAAGAQVSLHLPHRIHEGYGLKPMSIMQLALPARIGLIITVDNGSSSFDAVTAAKRFGIDVIITDHHNIEASVPEAVAVVNPKLDPPSSELADLAGVGVAFYLVIALRTALRNMGWWRKDRPEPNLKAYCDLVAIGTLADMVPLRNVNRVLVCAGLEQINCGTRTGVQALLKSSGVKNTPISADDIAYRIAPRINAAGRLNSARIAFDLLTCDKLDSAATLANDLNALNQRRQQMENDIFEYIIRHLDNRSDLLDRKAFVLAGAQWHEGVIGIVAAKLVARYHRPVIVVSAKDDMAKGSGRSVPHIDLYTAIAKCAHLLEAYGGHRLAAGISLQTKNIGALQNALETAVAEMTPPDEAGPQLTIDHELQLDQICPQLIDELEWLSPFGTENPPPLFMARGVKVTRAAIIGQRHRRMQLCQPDQCSPPIGAIEFNLAQDAPRLEAFERLAFRLQWNRYKGEKEIQMIIEAY